MTNRGGMWRGAAAIVLCAVLVTCSCNQRLQPLSSALDERQRDALAVCADSRALDLLADARIAAVEAYARFLRAVVCEHSADARLADARCARAGVQSAWRDVDDARLEAAVLHDELVLSFTLLKQMLHDECSRIAKRVEETVIEQLKESGCAEQLYRYAKQAYMKEMSHAVGDLKAAESRGMATAAGHEECVAELRGTAAAIRRMDIGVDALSRLRDRVESLVGALRARQALHARQTRTYLLAVCAVALAESRLDGLCTAVSAIRKGGSNSFNTDAGPLYRDSVWDGLSQVFSKRELSQAVSNSWFVVDWDEEGPPLLRIAHKTLSQSVTALVGYAHAARSSVLDALSGRVERRHWDEAHRLVAAGMLTTKGALDSVLATARAMADVQRNARCALVLAGVRRRASAVLRPYADFFAGRVAPSSFFAVRILLRAAAHRLTYGGPPIGLGDLDGLVRASHAEARRRLHRSLMAQSRENMAARKAERRALCAQRICLSALLLVDETAGDLLYGQLAPLRQAIVCLWSVSEWKPAGSVSSSDASSATDQVATNAVTSVYSVGGTDVPRAAPDLQSLGTRGNALYTTAGNTLPAAESTESNESDPEPGDPLSAAVRQYDALLRQVAAHAARVYARASELIAVERERAAAAGEADAWREVHAADCPEVNLSGTGVRYERM